MTRPGGEPPLRRVDCAVIGAGPAGSAAALRLARLGLTVAIFDDGARARHHSVESIAESALPGLAHLGVAEAVMQTAAATASRVHWAGEAAHGKGSLVVDRPTFDRILAGRAKAEGARIHRATVVACRRGEGEWKIAASGAGGPIEMAARFVVFASGRRGLAPARRQRLSPPLLAVTARLRRPAALAPTSSIEAGEAWWFWSAPIGDDRIQVTLFIAPDSTQLGRKREFERGLRCLLAESLLLARLAEAPLDGTLQSCDASRTIATELVGDDFIAVGDAAFTVDPLSSQGVPRAIASAEQGAVVANTLLRRPADGSAAKTFFAARQREAVDADERTASGYYALAAARHGSPFWMARSQPATGQAPSNAEPVEASLPLRLAPDAEIVEEPVVAGGFIELRPALRHAGLARPIAFVRDAPVAALLAGLPAATTAGELLRRWSAVVGARDASGFLALLWSKAVLVRAEA